MKKTILFMAGLFCHFYLYSQIRYNDRFDFDNADAAYSIKPTSLGYLITGPTAHYDSLTSRRVQAFEIGLTGNLLSYKSYSKLFTWYYSSWYGNLIEYDNSSLMMLGDISDTTDQGDFMLFKFDSNGDTLWTKQIHDPYFSIARNLCKANDGGLVLVGQWDSASTTQLDIVMRKTDSLGNLKWERYFTQAGNTYHDALSVIPTKDHGFLFGGLLGPNASIIDALVIKTDSSGNEQWRRIIGNQYDQGVVDIVETDDSNFVITGTWATNNTSTSPCEFWLTKLNKNDGSDIWQRFYSDTITEKGFRSIIELNDGSIVCAGLEKTGQHSPFFGTIFKFSSNGDSLWLRNYLPPQVVKGWGYLNDIIATSDGGFIAVGEAGGDGLSQDTWILKVDSEGCEIFNCLTTGISEKNLNENGLVAYPNPVSGNHLQLLLADGLKHDAILQVFNSTGAIVFSEGLKQGTLTGQLDISKYASGLYFLKLTGKDISLQTKFVIEKE